MQQPLPPPPPPKVVPKFRDSIPRKLPPERAKWKDINFCEPFIVAPSGSIEGTAWEGWHRRARIAAEMDATTLSGPEALLAHEILDNVCDHVHAEAKLADTVLVWFDPDNNHFWAYPMGFPDNRAKYAA
jgi:hypothetical protein